MNFGGSHQTRAATAAGLAISHGFTPLECLLVGDVASYGGPDFRKDKATAQQITQRNGRNPHPKSVFRSRRKLEMAGVLRSVRVFAGQIPPGGRFATSGGTTSKTVNFSALRGRDPMTREERRQISQRLRRYGNPAEVGSPSVSGPERGTPRHSAPVRTPEARREPATLAETLKNVDRLPVELRAGARAAIETAFRREQLRDEREDAAMVASVRPKPPS